MKTRTFTAMGSLHPILFFAVVYVVALLFSIFICSSLFYSCNASSVGSETLGSSKGVQTIVGNTQTTVAKSN